MNSSRGNEVKNLDPIEDSTIEWVVIEDENDITLPSVPLNFPKRCKFIRKFTDKKDFQEGRKTFHPVNTAFKNGKKYYIKFNLPFLTELHEKLKTGQISLEKAEIVTQLEAAIGKWYQLGSRNTVSKKIFPCYTYDEKLNKYIFNAVASEELPQFRPNRFDPLLKKDLIIESLDVDLGQQRNNFKNAIKQLSEKLIRSNDTWWNWGKEKINYANTMWGSGNITASWLKEYLDNILNKKEEITDAQLIDILHTLNQRQLYIESPSYIKAHGKDSDEENKLKNAITQTTDFLSLKRRGHVDVKKLVEMDRIITKKEIEFINQYDSLDPKEKISGEFLGHTFKNISVNELRINGILPFLNETEKFSELVFNKPFEMSVNDVINYRLVKGQADGLVESYLKCENDLHNKNLSKNGKRVDFDMSEWPFFSKFKQINFYEWLFDNFKDLLNYLNWNTSPSDAFGFSDSDIDDFPNIQAPFRYFPTKPSILSDISQSHFEIPYLKIKIPLEKIPFIENFYNSKNSEAYCDLAKHPVFEFHKYKAFLKNILISEKMYRKSAELYIRNDLEFVDADKKTKNLLDELVNYKVARMQQFKNRLLKNAKFRNFLVENGEYAFQLIKEEFEEERATDSDSKEFINISEVEEDYYRVLIHSFTGNEPSQEDKRALDEQAKEALKNYVLKNNQVNETLISKDSSKQFLASQKV